MESTDMAGLLQLPHNDGVEMSVIGTIIGQGVAACNRKMEHVSKTVSPLMFYQPQHRQIFQIMTDMMLKGEDIDLSSLSIRYMETQSGKENSSYLFQLADFDQLATLDTNVDKLVRLYKGRQLVKLCYKAIETVTEPMSGGLETATEELTEGIKSLDDNHDSNLQPIRVFGGKLYDIMNENACNGTRRGIPTGFEGIDTHGYFQDGDLVVVAAESSQGKTAFTLDIVVNIAKQGIGVAIYSMEMNGVQLASRALAPMARISAKTMVGEPLTDEEMARTGKPLQILSELPIFIDEESTTSVNKMYQSIRLAARRGIKVVVVDFLQVLYQNDGKQDTQDLFYGDVARRLKNMAKDLKIIVILLSQLSRNNDTPEPSLRRIRGSGQVNEAADWTFTIYRPEVYKRSYTGEYSCADPSGTAQIRCEKGRNVGTFSFICGFDADHTHFYNLSPEELQAKKVAGGTGRPF